VVSAGTVVAVTTIAVIVVMSILAMGVKIIRPYEAGIYLRMGRFVRVLDQGFNFVTPLVNMVVRMDLRTQVFNYDPGRVFSEEGRQVRCRVNLYYAVQDPFKAFFKVTNYRTAVQSKAEEEFGRVFSGIKTEDISSSRNLIVSKVRSSLFRYADEFGVEIKGLDMEILGLGSVPCPKCRFENPVQNRYCGGCGSDLWPWDKAQASRTEPERNRSATRASPPHMVRMPRSSDDANQPRIR